MNLEHLRADACDIDWTPVTSAPTVDEQVELFTNSLVQLFDRHAPIRAVKVKHSPAPWLTEEIKKLLNKKAAAKHKLKRRPSVANKEQYVAIRNRCNLMCRDAQRQHIHKSVQNGDPAKVWQFLRSIGVGKSKLDNTPTENINLDSLNLHFSACPNFNRAVKTNTLDFLSKIPSPNFPQFFLNHFSNCDVRRSIVTIASNAVGCDCVSRRMIIPILDEVLPIISFILNYSISSSTFPRAWKDAQIIPLPKTSKPSSFSDFRPISILPFLSKVLESLIHSQLSLFLSRNALLNPFQSGFRRGHSTTTALVHITDDIRAGMEVGNLTVLALLDFSNAFNAVDFDVLLAILSSLNISPSVIDWFHSYLFGRRQRVCLDDLQSSWCNTVAGVPQGGVLSPLLFALFINSISLQLSSSYHLYADDLQIYFQAPVDKLSEAFSVINQDLARVGVWSSNFGLKVNPSKTQVIVIGSARMISRVDWAALPAVTFNGTAIPLSDSVKNLGIHIDKTLSWSVQLKEVSRKMFASASSLRRLRNFLPTATKIALAQSLLLPILDYADISYLDLTAEQLDKLERLQNFCIRFIFGLRKYDHVSEFRAKLNWLPIRLRRNAHILSLLYNILFNPATPQYLKNRFSFLSESHSRSLRSSENLVLKIPAHSSSFCSKSFSVLAAQLWNKLPLAVRRAQSLFIFKKLLKEHYLTL